MRKWAPGHRLVEGPKPVLHRRNRPRNKETHTKKCGYFVFLCGHLIDFCTKKC